MGRFLVSIEVDTAEWEREHEPLTAVGIWDHFASMVEADPALETRIVSVTKGAAAERVIASARAEVLEEMGYGSVADEVRRGTSPSQLAALVEEGSDAEREIGSLLQHWAEEDAKGGQS